MNLQETISIYAGGLGSGCNPAVGQCGKHGGTVLYHATTEASARKILKQGLQPGHRKNYEVTRKGKVYLTNSLARAKFYAAQTGVARGANRAAILKFELPQHIVNKLQEDWMDVGRSSLRSNRSFTYDGRISAKHVQSVYREHPLSGQFIEHPLR